MFLSLISAVSLFDLSFINMYVDKYKLLLRETAKESGWWLGIWKSTGPVALGVYWCLSCFQADSLIFKDRKLNVGPAIRKQVYICNIIAVALLYILTHFCFVICLFIHLENLQWSSLNLMLFVVILFIFSCLVYGTARHLKCKVKGLLCMRYNSVLTMWLLVTVFLASISKDIWYVYFLYILFLTGI